MKPLIDDSDKSKDVIYFRNFFDEYMKLKSLDFPEDKLKPHMRHIVIDLLGCKYCEEC